MSRTLQHACHWWACFSLTILLISTVAKANAIIRCEDRGRITYTDASCTGGKEIVSNDLRENGTMESDRHSALQRAANEKRLLKELETSRLKDERIAEKQNIRRSATAAAHRKKCNVLALRKKWRDEEAVAASGHAAHKAKRKSQQMAELYTLECGK